MNSSSDGAPSATPNNNNNNNDRDRSGHNNRNRNRSSNQRARSTKFEGDVPALKDYVYDVGGLRNATDDFHRTTRKIAEYFSHEHTGAGESANALDPDVLKFNALTAPVYPPNRTAPDFDMLSELWKADHKEYRHKLTTREELTKRAHSVVLGQCSPAVCDRLEAQRF
jgi:hypothetical protein